MTKSASLERGQLFSTDFLLALFIFLSALVLGLSFFNRFEASPQERLDFFAESSHAQQYLDALVRLPGNPSNWSNERLPNTIGLANSPYVLDEQKLNALSNWWQLDSNAVRSKMGITQSFSLQVLSLSDQELFKIGDPVLNSSSSLSRYESFSLLDGNVVQVLLEVGS